MAQRTVLVVEDSEVEAQMLERGLRNAISRSAVVLVNTTTEAEKYLFLDDGKRPNPDLVVLDVRIPPAGGMGLLKKLRSNARTRTIPVVMMSSHMADPDVEDL